MSTNIASLIDTINKTYIPLTKYNAKTGELQNELDATRQQLASQHQNIQQILPAQQNPGLTKEELQKALDEAITKGISNKDSGIAQIIANIKTEAATTAKKEADSNKAAEIKQAVAEAIQKTKAEVTATATESENISKGIIASLNQKITDLESRISSNQEIEAGKITQVTDKESEIKQLKENITELQNQLDKCNKDGPPQTQTQLKIAASNFDQLVPLFNTIEPPPNTYYTPAFSQFIDQFKKNEVFGPKLIKNLQKAYALFNKSIESSETVNQTDFDANELKQQLDKLKDIKPPGSKPPVGSEPTETKPPGSKPPEPEGSEPTGTKPPGSKPPEPEGSEPTGTKPPGDLEANQGTGKATNKDINETILSLAKNIKNNKIEITKLIDNIKKINEKNEDELSYLHGELNDIELIHKNLLDDMFTFGKLVKENNKPSIKRSDIEKALQNEDNEEEPDSSAAGLKPEEQTSSATTSATGQAGLKPEEQPLLAASLGGATIGEQNPNEDEEDEDEDDAENYSDFLKKQSVASAAAEFYSELETKDSYNSAINKLNDKELAEKLNKVTQDIYVFKKLVLDYELRKLLKQYKLDSVIDDYNNLIKNLNEELRLKEPQVKKGGGAKSLIEEQMQLIKDSHALISKILKQKSLETRKSINKRLKNINNKITKKKK